MVLGAITLVAIALAPIFMPWFALGLSPELKAETVRLAQVMFPIILLLALTGILAAVLQANGEFGVTGFVPVLWNAVIIVCLGIADVALPPGERVMGYAIGIVLGTLAQLLWLLPYMRGKGPFKFSLGRGVPEVRKVFVMMLPVSLGLGLININASVDNVFAGLVSARRGQLDRQGLPAVRAAPGACSRSPSPRCCFPRSPAWPRATIWPACARW